MQFDGRCIVLIAAERQSPSGSGWRSCWCVQDLEDLGHRPAQPLRASDQPVIFSATRLRKVMLPEVSVQATASPMQLSVTWARSFSTNSASSMALRSTA